MGSSDNDLLSKPKFTGIEIGNDQRHDHQDQRRGRTKGWVTRIQELSLDRLPTRITCRPPRISETMNVPITGMNTKNCPSHHTRHGNGSVTRRNVLIEFAPKSAAASYKRGINFFKRCINRQNHERQKFIDHAHQHRARRIQHLQRREWDIQQIHQPSQG